MRKHASDETTRASRKAAPATATILLFPTAYPTSPVTVHAPVRIKKKTMPSLRQAISVTKAE